MVKKSDVVNSLTLVIAEKPSVAADLARAITVGGKFKKKKRILKTTLILFRGHSAI